ncbi:2-amino-4-hydroxy-6-hydroxymethyldihydropteridine diphosphokinase [Paenibacillus septentrionalis]|uniref:2-amino-4-hydroxy-6-hydroxymethyldihydropteridine diphosphokinase n=1 Tax=Paenibacillus septentrionalis TaxID=429342 RepID=A0ABW1V917_9BACL
MSNTSNRHTAYIALGSNLGDREQWLLQAIKALEARANISVEAVSALYETDPVGYTDQDAFLNMAIKVSTTLSPLELLREQLDIENELGRVRQVRWGPRTIDLDLLLYDNVSLETEQLILPHPRMLERAFVLVPLHDVLELDHALYHEVELVAKKALQLRKEGITLWKTINWPNV